MRCKGVSHSDQTEIWLPVVGFEAWYEVSNAGRVRRIEGRTAGTILKPCQRRTGYLGVHLNCDGAKSSQNVHVLVARAFHGPRPSNHEVNHKDGSKANNHADNLEYVTHLDNVMHAIKAGLVASRLTPELAKVIKSYPAFVKDWVVASRHNLPVKAVNAVRQGQTWKHIVAGKPLKVSLKPRIQPQTERNHP